MTDKEIYEILLSDNHQENIVLFDDDQKKFELIQLGIVPMHGVVYAVLDLFKIDDVEITEEDSGLVILELDYDDESDTYYVTTVDDDELFDEIMEAFDQLPVE